MSCIFVSNKNQELKLYIMKTIKVPTKEQVDSKAGAIFDNLQANLGMIPNIYATIGYSSDVLEAYLNYSNAIQNTSFNKKEGEAIKLAVSEVNQCEYCTAAHTVLAKMNGFSEDETIQIRKARLEDEKLNTLVKAAQEIALKNGAISEEMKNLFFAQGYDVKAFIDLIATVNAVSFTNYIHNATKIAVDFPATPSLLACSA